MVGPDAPPLWRRRTTEGSLLVTVIAFYVAGLVALSLANNVPSAAGPAEVRLGDLLDRVGPADLAPIILLPLAHLYLRWRVWAADQLFLPIAGLLSALGLLIVRRLEPDLAVAQSIWFAIGIGIFLATVSFPNVRRLRLYKYTLALGGLALLAITAVVGREAGGARLWLQLGGISFQPTELLKVVLVLFMASYLEEKRDILAQLGRRVGPFRLPPIGYLGPLALMWGLSLLLLVWQRDMGATLLLLGTAILMLYVATGRLAFVVGGFGLFAINVAVGLRVFGYIQTRMAAWLQPWEDPQDTGYQIIQALVAFANGGFFGAGLGHGHPSLIPAVHTDFVFAAIGEELGAVVTLPLLAIYLVFALHGLAIAARLRDDFTALMVTGLCLLLGLQTTIITAGNLQVLPLTGITLPFVSYGGSSMVANYLALGLLLRLTADATRAEGGGRPAPMLQS